MLSLAGPAQLSAPFSFSGGKGQHPSVIPRQVSTGTQGSSTPLQTRGPVPGWCAQGRASCRGDYCGRDLSPLSQARSLKDTLLGCGVARCRSTAHSGPSWERLISTWALSTWDFPSVVDVAREMLALACAPVVGWPQANPPLPGPGAPAPQPGPPHPSAGPAVQSCRRWVLRGLPSPIPHTPHAHPLPKLLWNRSLLSQIRRARSEATGPTGTHRSPSPVRAGSPEQRQTRRVAEGWPGILWSPDPSTCGP